MGEAIVLYRGRGSSVDPELLKPTTITSNGTYTAPVTGTYRVSCVGGGGGGGGGCRNSWNSSQIFYGGAGARGSLTVQNIDLNAGDKIQVNLGVGGTGGTNNTIVENNRSTGTNGMSGGITTFGNISSSSGGSYGLYSYHYHGWQNKNMGWNSSYKSVGPGAFFPLFIDVTFTNGFKHNGSYFTNRYSSKNNVVINYSFYTGYDPISMAASGHLDTAPNNPLNNNKGMWNYRYGPILNNVQIDWNHLTSRYIEGLTGSTNASTSWIMYQLEVVYRTSVNRNQGTAIGIILGNGLNKSGWSHIMSELQDHFINWANHGGMGTIDHFTSTSVGSVRSRIYAGQVAYSGCDNPDSSNMTPINFSKAFMPYGIPNFTSTMLINEIKWNNQIINQSIRCYTSIQQGTWWYQNDNQISTSGTRIYRGDGGASGQPGNAGFVLVVPPQL